MSMQNQAQQLGDRSLRFDHAPYILADACIVGEKEGQGPYGDCFDRVEKDPYFGKNSWEEAESELQLQTARLALHKGGLSPEDIRYLFAGDLLGQTIATSFGLMDLNRPLFGLYGACSTLGESLSLGAMCVAAGYAPKVLCVTSSHFGSAEKQFRFPLEYGNQRPLSATWTVTGSGAYVLSSDPGSGAHRNLARITGITTGVVTDYGVEDSMNMGAAMAPAACDTIFHHLRDFDRRPADYDRIITGDLGTVGQEILFKLLKDKGYEIADRHMDCGIEIFDAEKQDTHAGGSGCGCSASLLSAHILKQVRAGNWKRVLMVPTGALLSTVSFNEGQSVPGIAHAVVIEHL